MRVVQDRLATKWRYRCWDFTVFWYCSFAFWPQLLIRWVTCIFLFTFVFQLVTRLLLPLALRHAGDCVCVSILFYFISFIGHRNSRLQGERPMGLVQTGKRDPCKAQDNFKKLLITVMRKFVALILIATNGHCPWTNWLNFGWIWMKIEWEIIISKRLSC